MGLRKEIGEGELTPRAAQRQTAEYVGRMAADLRAMAAKSDLGFLAYLLGMVEEEASRQGIHEREG